jgi:hypothetical protein
MSKAFCRQGSRLAGLRVCLMLVLITPLAGGPRLLRAADSSKEIGIAPVLQAVHEALVEAAQYQQPGFPDLSSITVTLATDTSKDASGKVKLLIFTIGGGPSTDSSSTLTVQMKPPTEKPTPNVQGVNPATLKSALAGALLAAQQAFNQARQVNDQLNTSLRTNKVQVEVKFTVKKVVEGGIDTATLLPIGLSATGKYSKSQIQTVTLAYGE